MRAYFDFRTVLAAAFFGVAARGTPAQVSLDETSAGVDAHGVRHTWTTGRAKPAPWQADVVKLIPPEYPYVARRSKQEGSGLFRLQIEQPTGKVTSATILKSTGVAVLDNSALWALRRWQIKPERWRELDVPVTFTMSAPLPAAFSSKPHK